MPELTAFILAGGKSTRMGVDKVFLQLDGRTLHTVGLPYHFGYAGLVTGDVVNDLLPISEEPNVRIMESKALVCSIRPSIKQVDDANDHTAAPARFNRELESRNA